MADTALDAILKHQKWVNENPDKAFGPRPTIGTPLNPIFVHPSQLDMFRRLFALMKGKDD